MEENLSSLGSFVQDRMKAEEKEHHKERDNKRWRRFFIGNLVLPSLNASIALIFFGVVLFRTAGLGKNLLIFVLHFVVISLLLFIFWVTNFCFIESWFKRWKRIVLLARNFLYLFFMVSIFPFQLFLLLVDAKRFASMHVVIVVIFLILLIYSFFPTIDSRIIRKFFPAKPSIPKALRWQGMKQLFKFLVIVFSFLIVEMWFLSQLATQNVNIAKDFMATGDLIIKSFQYPAQDRDFCKAIPVAPYIYLFYDFKKNKLIDEIVGAKSEVPDLILMNYPEHESPNRDLLSARLAVWLFASVLLTFLMIALGGINMQVMEAVMPTALFQIEKSRQNAKEIIMKSGIYARNLRDFLIRKHSFTVVGGFLGSFIYLGIPAILYSTGKYKLILASINEDTFFFAFALFAAWIVPVIVAINKVDDIFGENFNRSIYDIIMDIQHHVIFFGYGDLGRRVVDRSIRRIYTLDKENNIIELVTPDLIVARVCISALVIDWTDKNFVYAAESDLLGRYGVLEIGKVGGMRLKRNPENRKTVSDQSPWELKRGWFYSEKKPVLVPALKGNLAEPFTLTRANLERSKVLISTVTEHYGVNAAFESLSNSKTGAVLCITRSDQLTYLTYRASTRPIALVYAVAIQGATMGQRLWASVEKMTALRNIEENNKLNKRPKIYIIGENIAKHYLLENLWMNIPGSYKEKTEWLENHVVFIVAETPNDIHTENVGFIDYLISHSEQRKSEQPSSWQRVIRGSDNTKNEKSWKIEKYYLPIRFGTGGRYTSENKVPLLRIPVYDIRHAFGSQLDDIFQEELPDIIVVNPDNMESSFRVMMLTIRALERVHTSPERRPNDRVEFPLMLFTLLRGNQLENITIGDISRLYNGLVMLYGDELAKDESYPAHARWNRMRKKIVREAIIDSNADTEEIIRGIHESQFGFSNVFGDKQKNNPGYMEINTCVPNVPGCLASLVAHLSGFRFSAKNRPKDFEQIETVKIPSFQYLRSFQMDSAGRGLVVTGYSILNLEREGIRADGNYGSVENEGHNFYTRLYITDGNDYNREDNGIKTREIKKTDPPTVPEAIDYITARKAIDKGKIKVQRFKNILLDSDGDYKIGEKACPSMNTCPVASYQDYVVASNRSEFIDPKLAGKKNLKFSENYYCRENFLPVKVSPGSERSPAARIMLCARGEKGTPGILAYALNTLLFRSFMDAGCGLKRDVDDSKEWIFNAQYVKDMPCHNRFFGINRIFGYWIQREIEGENGREKIIAMLRKENPIQLIEILPIGSAQNAAEWLKYAKLMQKFINMNCEREDAYRLVWYNKSLKCSDSLTDSDRELKENILKDPPVAIIICKQNKKEMIQNRMASQAGDYRLCTICGLQGREYSCEKWRPWFKENEFRWDVDE